MNRNDLCWCGSGLKYKKCHLDFDDRIDSYKYDVFKSQCKPPHNIILTPADIEGIRKSGVVNDAALDLAGTMVEPGQNTEAIDTAVKEFIEKNGGIPACLNYEGFPKSICISINEVVCHGIPSKKTILKEGDRPCIFRRGRCRIRTISCIVHGSSSGGSTHGEHIVGQSKRGLLTEHIINGLFSLELIPTWR
jgi:hypothetical protein